MSDERAGLREQRFLILAPTGRDAALTAALLRKAELTAEVVSNMAELCEAFDREGAAAMLIAEEVFAIEGVQALSALVARQPAWSDVPILVFTGAPSGNPGPTSAQLLASLGNVTFLDRPLRPVTMLSAARASLRARQRQYEARAELAAQQRAVRERDQFLAMLGHELRNPLSAISMAINLDREGANSKYREIMRRQVSHLSRLVDDLLDVSRVTSGKISLRRERVDLAALVKRSVSALGSMLQNRQLALRLDADDAWVEGDPVRLEQVVNNLLSNAAKYTPSGGRIELSAHAEGSDVVLCVRDNGVGIAPDMIGRVFDLFTQAEHSLARSKGGMGVGLTLVRSLVELHGGQVQVESAGLHQGTQFTVRLPAVYPARESVERTTPEQTGQVATNRRRVLLIEDNDDSRELLSTLLTECGHRVTTAPDGISGLEQALASSPDVMLVDIGLPGLDGYGVATRVRQALGDKPYMIALTGYGQPEDRARALASGFDEHFTKPVDVGRLEALLSEPPPRFRHRSAS